MFILWFFAVLGFIFFWIIIGVIYFIIADPFNLRPLVKMMWQAQTTSTAAPSNDVSNFNRVESETKSDSPDAVSLPSSGPTDAQSAVLKSFGLDAGVAAQVTPQQEACFVEILGQARVDEVIAGAVPTASEFFAVRGCL